MPEVLNQDLPGLHKRINRFLTEIYKSQSSSISEVTAADQTRIITYIDAIDSYHSWMTSQPDLDLPETSPNPFTLEANPEMAPVESESCNDLIRQFQTLRDEIVNGQSARRSSGMIGFDSIRLTACTTKCRSFMTDFVANVTPLDLPESSPAKATSGLGRMGV